MNITQEADYAIRALLILSEEGEETKLDAKTIAERGCIPLRFLLKLLRKLTQVELVKSYRGVNGGYALAKASKDINLRDIIEAVEGPIAINRCLIKDGVCNANRREFCTIHKGLQKVQMILSDELQKITLEELKSN
jgi:Rrf2 family transcriptional regulator, iron-sulfur cluster assembly transcription factor